MPMYRIEASKKSAMNSRHYIYHVAPKCWPSTPNVAHNHVFQRGQEEGLDWTIKLLRKNSLSISPCWIVVPNML